MNQPAGEIFQLNDQSFEMVFRTFYSEMVGFAMRYVIDQDVGEEIVQETFANIWAKIDETEVRTNVRSYLFGAVRHACLNYLKHEKVVLRHAEHTKHVVESTFSFDFAELSELESQIHQAFEKLPPKCREVFELSRFEGLKYQEIAERLDLSVKTVERHMGKALSIFREELGEYLPIFLLLIELTRWG